MGSAMGIWLQDPAPVLTAFVVPGDTTVLGDSRSKPQVPESISEARISVCIQEGHS